MKIIRVENCHKCNCADTDPNPPWDMHVDNMIYYCYHENGNRKDVSKFVKNKTIPVDCPAEDVVQIITKMEVEEIHGSAL